MEQEKKANGGAGFWLAIAAVLIAGVGWSIYRGAEDKKTEPPAASSSLAIPTDDILACDRRSILYDSSKEKKEAKPEDDLRVLYLRGGDVAYTNMLVSSKKRTYVNMYQKYSLKPDADHPIKIQRVTEGFLIDCDSAQIWIDLNDTRESPVVDRLLIPVVGHIDVKPLVLDHVIMHAPKKDFIPTPLPPSQGIIQ